MLLRPGVTRGNVLCSPGGRAAPGERRLREEAAGDSGAAGVSVSAAAAVDVLRQEVGIFSWNAAHGPHVITQDGTLSPR